MGVLGRGADGGMGRGVRRVIQVSGWIRMTGKEELPFHLPFFLPFHSTYDLKRYGSEWIRGLTRKIKNEGE